MKDYNGPLSGARILITRAAHQSKEFADKLKELGANPIELPVIEIAAPESWQELDEAIANIAQYDWIVFASANAVRAFVERSRKHTTAERMPRIAVIGQSTERLAQKNGLLVDYKPDSFIAESFVQQFPGYPELSGQRFLWPRTNIGRNYIQEKLAQAGAQVDVVAAYRTILPVDINSLSEKIHSLLSAGELDIITLASAQTAANLAAIIRHKWTVLNEACQGQDDIPAQLSDRVRQVLTNVTVLSIGPQTSMAAHKHLGKLDLEASPHNTEGLVLALIKHFGVKRPKTDIQTI